MASLAAQPATSAHKEEISPSQASPHPVPTVSEANGILTLHFESAYVQSQMVVDKPDFLALTYTRTMMAFELFQPNPRNIALIGLGGGSLAKWCYRHHTDAKLSVVEINPHVIALREKFHIPDDDHRFKILCEDGTKFVAKHPGELDLLLVDAFGVDSLPEDLCSERFYQDCHQALTRSGLLVVNLCGTGKRTLLARIRRAFNGQILTSRDDDGNTVVFACKGNLLWPKGESPGSLHLKIIKFEKKYGLSKAMSPVS
jgi:spermidine synthase